MSESERDVARAKAAAHELDDKVQAQGTGQFMHEAHMSQQTGRDWHGTPPKDPASMRKGSA